jgi:hypothetical protein
MVRFGGATFVNGQPVPSAPLTIASAPDPSLPFAAMLAEYPSDCIGAETVTPASTVD